MAESEWWRGFFSGVAVDLWLRFTSDQLTRDETDFIESILRLEPGSHVLDVPCGGGRHSIEMSRRGHKPTGVDLSADFLKAARAQSSEKRLEVEWHQREMTDLPWRSEFDGAFCFGNSFGYLDDAGNARFLAAVFQALKPGAWFVLDTGMTAESIFPSFQERRWFQVGDILFLINGRYDHATGRMETEYTFIRDGKSEVRPASTRVPAYRDLCGMLEAAGFAGCEAYSSLAREPFRLGSQRLLLVAARPKV